LNSKITTIWVRATTTLTPCTEGEGHADGSATCELSHDPAESKNPACVDASHAIAANQDISERPDGEVYGNEKEDSPLKPAPLAPLGILG
jgi:hypothetical protein